MDKEELNEFIKSFEENTKSMPKSKEYSLKCLVDAGIYTAKGDLSKEYKIAE